MSPQGISRSRRNRTATGSAARENQSRANGSLARGLAFAGLLAAAVFLVLAIVEAQATAAGRGGFSFDGGSPRERSTVRSALEASAFDWNVIAGHVTVHIKAGGCYAGKGQIWLDPQMLAHGRDAWGVIQHEFAHQVDYFLLDDRTRLKLTGLLGAKVWSPGGRIYRHREYGAERFASTLAWAYWPSAHNSVYRRAHAEATAMPVLKFRRLINTLIR